MPTVLVKRPTESVLYSMEMAGILATGETISSVTSVTADTPDGATALTISGATSSGTVAQFRVAGGTDGYTYEITVTVLTTLSNTKVDCGLLELEEC